jgi:hypothetical protein
LSGIDRRPLARRRAPNVRTRSVRSSVPTVNGVSVTSRPERIADFRI